MEIGNSVKVKIGVKDPDYDKYVMSGWQGRIIDIDEENDLVEIEWDSITLKIIPGEYINSIIDEDCQYDKMYLNTSEIELTQPRDTESDVDKIVKELNKEYGYVTFDEQEENIKNILEADDISVSMLNLNKYYKFLLKNIELPYILTGMEDFPWEEPYVFGGWSKKEYEKLKKDNASYTDKFDLIEFDNDIEDGSGIFVKVKRISDNKIFTLPLWDLKGIDKKSKNYQIISDYSSWMTNYQ